MAPTKANFIANLKNYGYASASAEDFRDWFGLGRIHDAGLQRALETIQQAFIPPFLHSRFEAVHFDGSASAKLLEAKVPASVLVINRSYQSHSAKIE